MGFEAGGFAALVTTDQNLPYQQNVAGRRIALLVLVAASNRVPDLIPLAPLALKALSSIRPGQVVRVELPHPPPDADATSPVYKQFRKSAGV